MFEKKKKPEIAKRLVQAADQSFGETSVKILVDTETGVNYMVVRNTLSDGIAVTPMYNADNEVLVTLVPKDDEE